ncbi:MAG: rhomboid family intramembrane serine protease [Pseudomonadota bacterium]
MDSDNITAIRRGADQKWVYRAPLVVTGLIGLMVSIHLILTFGPKPQVSYLEYWGSLVPARYNAGMIATTPEPLLILPPFTHMFLHGGFTHLVLNMLFLLAFGAPVANRFIGNQPVPVRAGPNAGPNGGQDIMRSHFLGGWPAGSTTFLAFFVASGLAGALAYAVLHLNDPVPAVGASGAISALMAASVRIARPVRGQGMVNIDGPVLPVTDPRVLRFSIAIIVLNVAIGLFGNAFFPGGADIAYEAHLGGFFFGLFALPLFDRFRQRGPGR